MKQDVRGFRPDTTAAASAASTNAQRLMAAATRTSVDVEISSGEISIRGLTVLEVLSLLARFPSLRTKILTMFGIVGEQEEKALDAAGNEIDLSKGVILDMVMQEGAPFVAALIAYAAGEGNDRDLEAALVRLGNADVDILVDTIIEQTMPEGFERFFGQFARMATRFGIEKPKTNPKTSGGSRRKSG